VALALANLASVSSQKGEFDRAEPIFRDVVARCTEALSADDLNTGIARIKLGRSLLGLGRYREAAGESLAGYQIVSRQADPGVSYLRAAREDLAAACAALGEEEKAAPFRAELAGKAAGRP
jgi:serine/threonine-protein kinase